ncbi:hypothetical protein DPMN_036095 [Dreissena polymorpha]|uniref:Uncharacterized protein n=1 Tax=Dreissena polymorpha TaxID=45954 RepID=A0A9D4M8J1_DREPO|nr:hypothetical protein DPMN_036095 [Dreissena polymorpha]
MADADVLSLGEDTSDNDFSGFLDQDIHNVNKKLNSKRKVLPKVTKIVKSKKTDKKSKKSSDKQQKSSDNANMSSDRIVNSSENILDITKLSQKDIASLRNLLGIEHVASEQVVSSEHVAGSGTLFPEYEDEVEVPYQRQVCASDDEQDYSNLNKGFSDALFCSDNNNNIVSCDNSDMEWDMPKLKTPVKGKPVCDSLAKLINVACSTPYETDVFLEKYKVPENCDHVTPPLVNQEIWKILDKKSHANDRLLVDIHNLVASGFAPIIKLADLLNSHISAEAKNCISYCLTILGQVQYHISVRRRYMIRPCLRKNIRAYVRCQCLSQLNYLGWI